jgi:hypothetical protein
MRPLDLAERDGLQGHRASLPLGKRQWHIVMSGGWNYKLKFYCTVPHVDVSEMVPKFESRRRRSEMIGK